MLWVWFQDSDQSQDCCLGVDRMIAEGGYLANIEYLIA